MKTKSIFNFYKKNITIILSAILVVSMLPLNQSVEAKNNIQYKHLVGCDMSSGDKKFFKKNFNSELKKRGIPKSIKKGGKTLKIDKNFTINNCTALYGSPGKVANNVKEKGEYQYLGYGINGVKVENLKFHNLSRSANFLDKNVNKFITNPRSNSKLVKATQSKWTIKPNIKKIKEPKVTKGMKKNNNMSKTKALNTAIDKDYLLHNNKGVNGNLGKRGYFGKLGKLKGNNLKKRAVVSFYPDEYSFGMFYMYRNSNESFDGYAYSSHSMPPLKTIFNEDADLAVSKFAVTKSEPWEKDKITFKVKLKNEGEVAIKNPTAKFEFNGKSRTLKFPGTYNPGDTTKQSTVKITVPEISEKDYKKMTAKVTANPDKDNPKNDLNYKKNNIKEKEIKIKRIKRDLSVEAIKIDGNEYFADNDDDLEKYFENEEVKFEYKLKFWSNKEDEVMVNPTVKYGKKEEKNGEIQNKKEEKLDITLEHNETSDWLTPDYEYSN